MGQMTGLPVLWNIMLNSVCNTNYMQARHVSSMQPTLAKYAINPVVKIKYEFILWETFVFPL